MPSKGRGQSHITQCLAPPAEKERFYFENEKKLRRIWSRGGADRAFIFKDSPLSMWGLGKRAVSWRASDTKGQQTDGARKLMRVHG